MYIMCVILCMFSAFSRRVPTNFHYYYNHYHACLYIIRWEIKYNNKYINILGGGGPGGGGGRGVRLGREYLKNM